MIILLLYCLTWWEWCRCFWLYFLCWLTVWLVWLIIKFVISLIQNNGSLLFSLFWCWLVLMRKLMFHKYTWMWAFPGRIFWFSKLFGLFTDLMNRMTCALFFHRDLIQILDKIIRRWLIINRFAFDYSIRITSSQLLRLLGMFRQLQTSRHIIILIKYRFSVRIIISRLNIVTTFRKRFSCWEELVIIDLWLLICEIVNSKIIFAHEKWIFNFYQAWVIINLDLEILIRRCSFPRCQWR